MANIILTNTETDNIPNPPLGSTLMFFDLNSRPVIKDSSGVTQSFAGDPFPYTGNAVIDGTLNIDFTDTLDLVMGEVDYSGIIQGDFIGQTYRNGNMFGFVGFLDGTHDLPVQQWVMQFKDENTDVVAGCNFGFVDLGGDEYIQMVPLKIEVPDSIFEISSTVDPVTQSYQFNIIKESPNGVVEIGTSKTQTQFVVETDLDDQEKVFVFRDNEDEELFAILGQFITSQNILNDREYADDATAATANVPVGAFYHTGGVLKIRRPLP
jgi:hypothetical protein